MASIFQTGISRNTKCALKDGFRKSSHNYFKCFLQVKNSVTGRAYMRGRSAVTSLAGIY